MTNAAQKYRMEIFAKNARKRTMLKRQDRETLMKVSGKIEAIASLIGNENASAELLNVSEMIDALLKRDDLDFGTCSLTKSVSLD